MAALQIEAGLIDLSPLAVEATISLLPAPGTLPLAVSVTSIQSRTFTVPASEIVLLSTIKSTLVLSAIPNIEGMAKGLIPAGWTNHGIGVVPVIGSGGGTLEVPITRAYGGSASTRSRVGIPRQKKALGLLGIRGSGHTTALLPTTSALVRRIISTRPGDQSGFLPLTHANFLQGIRARAGTHAASLLPRSPTVRALTGIGALAHGHMPLQKSRLVLAFILITTVPDFVEKLPLLRSYGEGRGVVTSQWQLAALNLKTRAVTEYSIEANSLAVMGGVLYLATTDGIVCLMGDNDLGEPLQTNVVTGLLDGGDDRLKRVGNAYLGLVTDGVLTLAVITDDGVYEYPVLPPVTRRAGPSKTQLGRGLRSRYWQFCWRSSGTRYALDSLDIDGLSASRRV